MEKKLYRSRKDAVVGGVCSGLAEYFGIDVVVARLLMVFAVLFGGGGVIAYIIMWIIIPEKPRTVQDEKDDPFQAFDKPVRKKNNQAVIGVGLIGLGIYMGVDRFLPWSVKEYFWPMALVLVGVFILLGRKDDM